MKPNFYVRILPASLLLLASLAQPASRASEADKMPPKPRYVIAGRLFDGTSEELLEKSVIVVAGERIQQVMPASETNLPPGADIIDLSGATVLPGLIDCHTHLGARADRYDEIYDFKDSPFNHAFAAVVNARKTLLDRTHFSQSICAIPSMKG